MKRKQIFTILGIVGGGVVAYIIYKKFIKPKLPGQKAKAEELKQKILGEQPASEAEYWDLVEKINGVGSGTLPVGWTPEKDIDLLHSGLYPWYYIAEEEEKIYSSLRNKNAWQIKLIFDGFYDKTMKKAEDEIFRLLTKESERSMINSLLADALRK